MESAAEQVLQNEPLARLEEALPEWLRRVPLYQGGKYDLSVGGTGTDFKSKLAGLPFISKADLRRNFPVNFLGENTSLDDLVDRQLVEVEHTSGTSEDRTALLLPRGWWNRQELAALRLNRLVAEILDANPDARRVTINSPVCNNDICYTTVPTKSERVVGSAYFPVLSRYPFIWDETELARIVEETLEWQPVFLDVDPVYGMVVAKYCLRHKVRFPSLRFIFCSYEYPSVNHRRILERAFGVPVFNLYGSTETGHLLMEDESGQMLPSLETAFLEVINVNSRGVGELVVNTLTNDYMPLVRFRIGDLVEKTARQNRDTYKVHGRAKDAFHLPGGETVTVGMVDQCFEGREGVAHYQLQETEPGGYTLRFITDGTTTKDSVLKEIAARLALLLKSPKPVEIEKTDLLLPEGSGKFRLCHPLGKA